MPTMPGFARRWWRATAFLAVEAAAGVVSLALLPAAVLLAVLTVIGPGWFVAPHGVRLLRGGRAGREPAPAGSSVSRCRRTIRRSRRTRRSRTPAGC